jgi:hypothetical protein
LKRKGESSFPDIRQLSTTFIAHQLKPSSRLCRALVNEVDFFSGEKNAQT